MKPHILLFFLISLLLAACSTTGEPPESPEGGYSDNISLRFQLLASGTAMATRSDDRDHAETESEYRQFEDGLDFSNLCMFVFARKASAVSEDERLIFRTDDFSSDNDTAVYINGSYGAYDVDLTIPKKQLDSIIFGEGSEEMMDPNGTENIAFRILIVANAYPASASEDDRKSKWEAVDGTTFRQVIEGMEEWSCPMTDIYDSKYAGDEVTGFYRGGSMPMYGSNIFVTTQKALYYSRPEARVYLGDIDMLRSLAKVRVVDNIASKNEQGYPKVAGVQFIGSQTQTMILPHNALYYKNGTQIHTPNMYEEDLSLSLTGAPVYKLGIVPEAWTTDIPAASRKGNVMAAYVPEQEIGPLNNNVDENGMPVFRIIVDFGLGLTQVYDVPMTAYGDQTFQFGANILRNHIYTLSVNAVSMADEKIVVEPWTPEYAEFDYTNNVAMAEDGALTFVPGTYAGAIDYTRGRVVLNDYPQAVIGSFGISQPMGARWRASLVTAAGELNAIQFIKTDEHGNIQTDATGKTIYTPTIEGIVNGKKTEFRVGATQGAGPQTRAAVLQVVVTTPDGLSVPVNILKTEEYGENVENITFIQNPNN